MLNLSKGRSGHVIVEENGAVDFVGVTGTAAMKGSGVLGFRLLTLEAIRREGRRRMNSYLITCIRRAVLREARLGWLGKNREA